MNMKTKVKAGGNGVNNNETLVQTKQPPTGLEAGLRAIPTNNNETLVKAAPQGLKVKTKIKAGIIMINHNEMLVRATPRQRMRV